jgi:hypothetical protein
MHNLVSAAAATGVNRSTILRAIKAGRISAQRDETNGWQIDPASSIASFRPCRAAPRQQRNLAQRPMPWSPNYAR